MGFFGWLFFRPKSAKDISAAMSSPHGSDCACCIHWVVAKSQQATSRCTCEKVPVLAGHGHASRVGQPGPSKFFTTSALNAEEELTWHADFILALAQYDVSRLVYIIFLRVAGVGGSLGNWDTVEAKELAAVGCQVNLSSWRMEMPAPVPMELPSDL